MGLGITTYTFSAINGSSDVAVSNVGAFSATPQPLGGLGHTLPTLLPTLIINNLGDPRASS